LKDENSVKNVVLMVTTSNNIQSKCFEDIKLNKVAQNIYKGSNLCDNSIKSEAFSSHVISNFLTKSGYITSLYKTETEISYCSRGSKKTDYIIDVNNDINKYRIAVEVKRVYDYNNRNQMDQEYVYEILNKANSKALQSNSNVDIVDRWNTQFLHILTTTKSIRKYIKTWKESDIEIGFSYIIVTKIKGNKTLIF